MDADRAGDVVGLTGNVVQGGVQVTDLAEAVAAQLQRGGHEAEAPLADVERGPPVVLGARVPVRHHHLGQRHAVGDRPDPAAVGVSDLVQDQAFPVVEADPQGPFLPAQLVAVQLERDPFRLGDVQRAHVVAGVVAGDEARHVLAHHLRGIDRAGVADVEQFHPVEVEHRMQAVDGMRVWIGAWGRPAPDVHPAHPPVPVLLGDQRVTVGPGVEQDQVQVGDPPAGQRGDDLGVAPQHRVGLEPLADRRVRLHAGPVLEAGDLVAGERDGGGVGVAVFGVPAGDAGLPDHRLARPPREQAGFVRFGQLDAGEPPPVADTAVAAQDGHGAADLVGRQRVEWMTGGGCARRRGRR